MQDSTNGNLEVRVQAYELGIMKRLAELAPRPLKFSDSKKRVFALYMRGYPNDKIAGIVGRTEWAVERHLASIYAALGIEGRGPNQMNRALLSLLLKIAVEEGGRFGLEDIAHGIPSVLPGNDYPPFKYDRESGAVNIGTRRFAPTKQEVALLNYLVDHPDVELERDKIRLAVWGKVRSNATWAYTMKGLMNQLQPDIFGPQYIVAQYGGAYRFSTTPENLRPARVIYNPEKGEVQIGEKTKFRLRGYLKGIMDFLYANANEFCDTRDMVDEIWTQNHELKILKQPLVTLKQRLDINSMQPSHIYTSSSKVMLMTK